MMYLLNLLYVYFLFSMKLCNLYANPKTSEKSINELELTTSNRNNATEKLAPVKQTTSYLQINKSSYLLSNFHQSSQITENSSAGFQSVTVSHDLYIKTLNNRSEISENLEENNDSATLSSDFTNNLRNMEISNVLHKPKSISTNLINGTFKDKNESEFTMEVFQTSTSNDDQNINNGLNTTAIYSYVQQKENNISYSDSGSNTTSPAVKRWTIYKKATTIRKLACYEIKCDKGNKISIAVVPEANLKPWGSNISFTCYINAPANRNVTVIWTHTAINDWKPYQPQTHYEILQKEIILVNGDTNQSIGFISTLPLINISKHDSGYYTCALEMQDMCCFVNVSQQFIAYAPPHYLADVTIVVAVCLIEVIVILILYNVSKRKEARRNKLNEVPLQDIQYTPIKNLPSTEELDNDDEQDEKELDDPTSKIFSEKKVNKL